MPSMMKSAALFGAFAASAMAHGTVSGIVADGTYHQGYNPSMQYQSPAPKVVGWSIPQDQDNGFVAPDAYADADIICHKGATNGQAVADVKAGGTVDFQWTTWPESHHGPVITYMANCGGDCTTADKASLKWNKIDAKGLIDGSSAPGTWATDNMISNNNTWTTTIPDSIASGQYVLRHEIIALHSAGQENGAQNYPQCVNVKVTGSGSEDLTSTGTLGTALYKADDAGIKVSIYSSLSDYEIPGPAMWTGASSGSSSGTNTKAAVAASTPAATSTQAATSTAVAAVEATTSAATTSVPSAAAVSSVVAALPSSILNEAITAVPTPTAVVTPSKELPSGFTVKDLLQWFTYTMESMLASDRKHARDLSSN